MAEQYKGIESWLHERGYAFHVVPHDLVQLWGLPLGRIGILHVDSPLCREDAPRGLPPKGELIGFFTLEEAATHHGIFDALGNRNYTLLEKLSIEIMQTLGPIFVVRRIEHAPKPVIFY